MELFFALQKDPKRTAKGYATFLSPIIVDKVFLHGKRFRREFWPPKGHHDNKSPNIGGRHLYTVLYVFESVASLNSEGHSNRESRCFGSETKDPGTSAVWSFKVAQLINGHTKDQSFVNLVLTCLPNES